MSDIIGGIIDAAGSAAAKFKQTFSYGPHPSIILWQATNNPTLEEKDTSQNSILSNLEDLIAGVRDKVEDIVAGSDENTSFNSFKFDAVVVEEHDAHSLITKVPASSGFLVSDHIINQNRVLRLHVVAANMQNSSAGVISVQGAAVVTGAIFNNPAISAIGGVYGAITTAFETSDRVQSTYELFNSLRTSGTKLYISTILGVYVNCVITGIKTKHDKDTSAILSMELTLEELQVINVSEDGLANAARALINSSYDYSEFAKMATGLGIGILGGVPFPGLGSGTPSQQLGVLKDKLSRLTNQASYTKGVIK